MADYPHNPPDGCLDCLRVERGAPNAPLSSNQRNMAEETQCPGCGWSFGHHAITCHQRCRDEIERLRAALQSLYDAVWESDPAARATVAARDALLGKQPVETKGSR